MDASLSVAQIRTIGVLIEGNDEACDPERWVVVEEGGLGSRRYERKVVGTVVAVRITGSYDMAAIALHRLYSDVTRFSVLRDGTIAGAVAAS